MNPVVLRKCAQRVFLALVAVSGLIPAVACGNGSPAKPNNNGYNNSFLNGTYVFSTAGTDAANSAFIALAGAFTANGSGSISGGTMDVIDPAVGVDPAVSITSGSYNVASDGRGQVKLASSAGNFTLDFVLTATAATPSSSISSHGLVTEFDNIGSGSGTLDLQTVLSGQSALAGPYAFSMAGSDSTGNPLSSAGAFTLGSSGTSTAGVVDFNRNAIPFLGTGLTASAILGTGTAPGTASLASSYTSSPLAFDFYPIDATHWKMIETDGNFFLAGDVFTQTGASTIPSGTLVFTLAGPGASGPIAAGGLMTSDGNGNFPSGSEDINNAGTATGSLAFSGTAAGAAGTGGRVLVGLNGFSPAIQWVVYPSSGGLLMMVTDTSSVMTGSAFLQSATTFTVPSGYGLNLTGSNPSSAIDTIAQFNATTASTNNMTGIVDENDQGSPISNISMTGTFTPDSPATGRGGISISANATALGGYTLEYYTVDADTAVFIEVDANPNPQVAVGSFEAQGGGISPATAMAAHRFEPVAHPFAGGKMAKKKK